MMALFSFETSGKIKPPSAEELAAADEDTAILSYTGGTADDGRPYYAYIAVRPSKYKEFHDKTTAMQHIIFSDYGIVVASGFAVKPPSEVVEEMRESYGFDERYAEKLEEKAKKEQEEFLDKQETKRIDNIVTMLKNKKPSGDADII